MNEIDTTNVGVGNTATEQPIFTEMKDIGHIGVFENFVKPEFCDSLIDLFEFWYTKKYFKNK